MWLTDLADVLRGAGLQVTEVEGWRTRGFHGGKRYGGPQMNRPQSGIIHHTAGPRQKPGGPDMPSLRVLINGHSTLPGPLSQLGLGFSGRYYVVAAGLCNHAGKVTNDRYANLNALGIEGENPGDGTPWPKVQYDAYVAGARALSDHYGIDWHGHKEVCYPPGNKIDPRFSMAEFRSDVTRFKAGKPTTGPVPVLAFGDRGRAVKALQEELRRVFPSYAGRLAVDGIYGPATREAVREFQRRANVEKRLNLTVDGITGPATRAALSKYGVRLP